MVVRFGFLIKTHTHPITVDRHDPCAWIVRSCSSFFGASALTWDAVVSSAFEERPTVTIQLNRSQQNERTTLCRRPNQYYLCTLDTALDSAGPNYVLSREHFINSIITCLSRKRNDTTTYFEIIVIN